MKRIVRLTESDLVRLVKGIIKEQQSSGCNRNKTEKRMGAYADFGVFYQGESPGNGFASYVDKKNGSAKFGMGVIVMENGDVQIGMEEEGGGPVEIFNKVKSELFNPIFSKLGKKEQGYSSEWYHINCKDIEKLMYAYSQFDKQLEQKYNIVMDRR